MASQRRHNSRQSNTVTTAEAIAACEVLAGFLRPMLREAQRSGDLGAVGFFSPLMQDLAALREAVKAESESSTALAVSH